MKRLFSIIVLIFLLQCFSACSFSGSYQEGYDTGYKEGYWTGHDEGYASGNKNALDGVEKFLQGEDLDLYETGYLWGYSEGYAEGEALSSNYDLGYGAAELDYEDKIKKLELKNEKTSNSMTAVICAFILLILYLISERKKILAGKEKVEHLNTGIRSELSILEKQCAEKEKRISDQDYHLGMYRKDLDKAEKELKYLRANTDAAILRAQLTERDEIIKSLKTTIEEKEGQIRQRNYFLERLDKRNSELREENEILRSKS